MKSLAAWNQSLKVGKHQDITSDAPPGGEYHCPDYSNSAIPNTQFSSKGINMIAWGMKRIITYGIALLIISFASFSSEAAQEEIWLSGSLEEIKAASPIIGYATMPLNLVKAIVQAVPSKYLKETKESGFDVPAIFTAVDAMETNELFDVTINDIHLVIRKFEKEKPDEPLTSSRLYISTQDFSVPIPLIMTGPAITLLQYIVKEFKGMDQQLSMLIEEIKKTSPGLLLQGEDRLMNSWLKILLK